MKYFIYPRICKRAIKSGFKKIPKKGYERKYEEAETMISNKSDESLWLKLKKKKTLYKYKIEVLMNCNELAAPLLELSQAGTKLIFIEHT